MARKLFLFSAIILAVPQISMAADANQYQVPFVSQAPRGNWKDPVFRDACEETSLIMAYAWLTGQSLDPIEVEKQLHEIAAWEVDKFGFHQDTSAADTHRIATEYFYMPAKYQANINADSIIKALEQKSIVVVPINAGKIYKKGPPRHMILITGFDGNKFTYNDPMKANGGNLTIDKSLLQAALRDYPSGIHKKVTRKSTAMITIEWSWLSDPNQVY